MDTCFPLLHQKATRRRRMDGAAGSVTPNNDLRATRPGGRSGHYGLSPRQGAPWSWAHC